MDKLNGTEQARVVALLAAALRAPAGTNAQNVIATAKEFEKYIWGGQ